MGQNTSTIWNTKLIALAMGLMLAAVAARGQALVRQPNTSLQMPPTPPLYGFDVVDAFPGVTFTYPIAMVSPPGETNRIFVAEQPGRIYQVTNLANPVKTLFLDISGKVTGGVPAQEQGLQCFTFHPGFATNGFIYVLYCSSENGNQGNGFYNHLSRFTVSPGNPNYLDPASELPLISQFDESPMHNANDVRFGPDGYLYVAIGDEGGQDDQFGNAQRIDGDFFSAILRIDVDKQPGSLPPNPHPGATTNYTVPTDNPFVGATSFNGAPVNPGDVRTEFYAVGLRNPWRMSFDPLTDELYLGDVGQGTREEVDKIVKGGNYGWSYREGTIPGPKSAQAPGGFTSLNPLIDYPHGNGSYEGGCIIGGLVYRGNKLTQLYGSYIFADYVSGNIWKLLMDGTNVVEWTRLAANTGIVSFGTDPRDGDILMADIFAGKIKRLVYNSSPVGAPLPPTLANAGVFSNLVTLQTYPGLVPYSLNVPFWSDNAIKTRWFSVPDTNLDLTFDANSNWSFPTGTVWVKHFELEMTNGVASSRRRLETRLLVKNSNGVYGVTYKWDASQTNATLVAETGAEDLLTIDDGGGILRTQRWIYPSRSQCQACHTAVAGHALGFNTRQLNRPGTFGANVTNQITALSEAGYFTTPVTNVGSLAALAHATNTAFSLEYRARSYLQANCAQCHQPGGAGRGNWDARITTPMNLANIVNGLLVEDFGNAANRVIKPGLPTNSVMLTRISHNDTYRMPPLGSTVLDTNAIALVSNYVRSLARIMPLGDSITQGDTAHNSYRRPLWQLLTNASYTVDFVGSLTNNSGGPPPNPDFDLNHEGHAGFKADDLVNNLPTWLPNASNDIVLLHIGTNDRLNGQDDQSTTNEISQVIDLLRGSNPKVAVLLAQIIPYGSPWSGASGIPSLNSNIAKLAIAKNTAQSPVILVDQFSGFDAVSDTYDGLHPNPSGEQKMAQRWFDSLSKYLLGLSNSAPTVVITSPEDQSSALAPGSFNLGALAFDTDGTVARVEFFANGTKVGEATNAPFNVSWTAVPVGTFSLSAIATDDVGAKATSAVVTVSVAPVPAFLRGMNLGGGAVVIEGQTWLSSAAAQSSGLTLSGGTETSFTYNFALSPGTDTNTKAMLQSFYYRSAGANGDGFTVSQTVTNGNYDVWFWVVENYYSGYRNMNVFIEGSQVATNIGDLQLGEWRKYGPYHTTVADGVLNLAFQRGTKGDPMITGLLLGSGPPPTNTGPPTISGLATNRTINEDTVLGPLPFVISDPDQLPNSLVLVAQSSNPSLIPVTNIVFSGSGSNRNLTLTPATNASGSSVISVIVSDAFGTQGTNIFTVNVLPVNDLPTVAITSPADGAFFSYPASFTVSVSANDADGPVTLVELFANGTPLASWTNAPYNFNWSGMPTGTYALTAIATDTNGAKATSAVVTANVIITPPFYRGINLGGAATTVEGQPWISFDDAQAAGLTPANASWNTTTFGFTPSPTPDAGTLTMLQGRVFRIGPPDGQGFTFTQTMTNGTYDVYVWAIEDFQSNFRRMSLKLEGTTVATNIGDLALGAWQKYGPYPVTISDGLLTIDVVRNGKGDPQLCGLLIQTAGGAAASNNPPTISTITNATIVEDTSTAALPFTIGDAESTPAQLTLAAQSSATNVIPVGGIAFGGSGSNRTVTVTPATNATGSSVISVIVSDPSGGAATNSFTVTVTPVNDYPTVSISVPSDNSFYSVPANIPVQVNAGDLDGTITNVTLKANGTNLAVWTNAPYTLTWSNVPVGSYALTAIASDNLGLKATSSVVNVTVALTPQLVLGVNLGGDATVVEGNTWLSWDAAQSNGLALANGGWSYSGFGFTPSPVPDAGTLTMLQGRVNRINPADGQGFTLTQPITNGSYLVYVWAIEDFQSNYRNMTLKLDGTTVATNIGDLAFGAWQKYGPYAVTVSDGALNIDVLRNGKGDPQLCGLLIQSATLSNSPPTVALTAPVDGSMFVFQSALALTATASDTSGTVSGVNYYAGGALVGAGSGSNWLFNWTNAPLTNLTLTAVATDNLGASATSTPASISVVLLPKVRVTNSGSAFVVEITGETNRPYRVLTSSNLVTWQSVYTNTATNGVLRWTNQPAGGTRATFYRAQPLP